MPHRADEMLSAMLEDKNFDDFADRFEKNIYQQTKGKIRLHLTWEDIVETIPKVEAGGLDILDAGCGTAYFSSLLARAPHRFELCDISASMLAQAQARFQAIPDANVAFHQLPVQQIHTTLGRDYDLVMLHAVLEWLVHPKEALDAVLPLVRPEGYFSLLFYNRHSLVYRHLVMGNYRRLNDRDVKGFGGTLTPTNPLEPVEVEQWLTAQGMEIVRKTGIRTFFDYQPREVKTSRSFEDTLEMEKRYCREMPYLYLGRYLHFLCKRAT